MADNIAVTPGSGATIGAENITVSGSSTLLQRVKISLGAYDIDNGDLASGNPMPVTGSTTLVNVQLPSSGSVNINVTGATTNVIVIPSTATGSIYLTALLVSNGQTAGTITLGVTNVSTAGNIVLGPYYFAANGGCVLPLFNPIKLTATTNFVATINSIGTLTVSIVYYVA